MYWNFTDILRTPANVPLSAKDGEPIVEIGFGNGEYVEYLAKSRPEALVVGIEVSQWCLAKAARRVLSAGLGNVRLLLGDARCLLDLAFEPHAVSEVYMNFPCPWPKKRHAKRRVNRPQFPSLISRALKRGGTFTLATDVDWYAVETAGVFGANGDFETLPILCNPEREYLTKYERKWREMGRDTYLMCAKKTAEDLPVDEREPKGVETMEAQMAFDTGTFRERLSSLKGDTIGGRDYLVKFRDVFFSEDDTALINVISVDEGFEQHYYLRVVANAGKNVHGQVDAVGQPYRTPAVRASLKHLMHKIGANFRD